ncbi:MAG: hypothetical protein M3680_16780 [Myxococcota bacterium]|nr:hypothetical protein [Myxococcota bacterium]
MMKTLFAVLLSTSLFACVAGDADGLETVELAENPDVDLGTSDDGVHVGPTAGIEQPDGPGVATRDDEGPHVTSSGLTAEAATFEVDRNAFEGSYVGSSGELAEYFEAARLRFEAQRPQQAGR